MKFIVPDLSEKIIACMTATFVYIKQLVIKFNTSSLRGSEENMFISYVKSYKPVVSTTISRCRVLPRPLWRGGAIRLQ